MFCSHCGADNKPIASYCRKCGIAFDAELETRVAQREEREEETRVASPRFDRIVPEAVVPIMSGHGDTGERRYSPPVLRPRGSDVPAGNHQDEQEIFSISPTLLFVKAGYVLSVAGALVLVAGVSAFAGGIVPTSLAVLLGLVLLLVPGYYHLMRRMIRYSLTETTLRVDQGLIARSTRIVPLRRIQDVTVGAGVAQRLLGIGDIIVDNANETGGKVVLKNIDDARGHANKLLKQISMLDS